MGKIAILCVFVALGFAGAFAADLMGYFSRIKDPVAILQTSSGTVRRLGNGELTWDRAKAGAVFGNKDTVSTGESGGAKLVFFAGGEMELGPGAMVHLVGNPGELKLDFVQGTAKIRIAKSSSGAIAVSSKGQEVAKGAAPGMPGKPGTKPGAETVVTTAAAPSRIQVEEVEDDTIKKIEIPKTADLMKGTIAAAKPVEKPADKSADKARDTKPGTSATTGEGAEKTASADKAAADKAGDGSDGNGAESVPLTAGVKEKEIKNPDKSLAAQAALQKDGEILNAKVSELPVQPELGFPENDAVADFSRAETTKLEWAQNSKASDAAKPAFFEVMLRKVDEKGGQVGNVQTYKSEKPSFQLPRLTSGRYQWSVRAVTDKGNRSPAAKSRWIEVKNTAKIGKPTVLPVEVQ